MSMAMLAPAELRTRGFEALVSALGWVNAVRFIQQYEPSPHNYTADRDRILPEMSAAEMIREMQSQGATTHRRA